MKWKKIESLPAAEIKKKGNILTAQEMGGILVIDYFSGGKHIGRYAVNPASGEHGYIRDGKYSRGRLASLVNPGCGRYYYSTAYVSGRVKFNTKGDEDLVKQSIKPSRYRNWEQGVLDKLDELERAYNREQSEKKEERRKERVQALMNAVPPEPPDLERWVHEVTGKEHYAFWSRDRNSWRCTCCGASPAKNELKGINSGRKAKHNEAARCPGCGTAILAQTRKKKVFRKEKFLLAQDMDEDRSVIRWFDAWLEWNEDGLNVRIDEGVRMVQFRRTGTVGWYHNQYGFGPSELFGGYFDEGNPAQRSIGKSYLYSGNPAQMTSALKGTRMERWSRAFQELAARRIRLDYGKLISTTGAQGYNGISNVVEYLLKGRFRRLLEETAEKIYSWSGTYHGTLDISGTDIESVFRISDRQKINRIRDKNGGEDMLAWMRWSDRTGKKINDATLNWLLKERLAQQDLEFILGRMTPEQIMNYVSRQKRDYMKTEKVLTAWADYLSMCGQLSKDTEDEMVYRPRELKRRHDEAAEELQRMLKVKELKENAAAYARQAEEMRKKFPGAEEVLQEIKPKFEYQNEDYMIIVPEKLIAIVAEGAALHHCAGSSDRYFDRIMQRETYICFLRKTADPEVPYYTIEVEPGGTIRQHRGYLDEEPEIEQVKPFLREWQKAIRSRMKEEDHAYARSSAAKRQENIEELKRKNNLRALKGLEEDFMEAM